MCPRVFSVWSGSLPRAQHQMQDYNSLSGGLDTTQQTVARPMSARPASASSTWRAARGGGGGGGPLVHIHLGNGASYTDQHATVAAYTEAPSNFADTRRLKTVRTGARPASARVQAPGAPSPPLSPPRSPFATARLGGGGGGGGGDRGGPNRRTMSMSARAPLEESLEGQLSRYDRYEPRPHGFYPFTSPLGRWPLSPGASSPRPASPPLTMKGASTMRQSPRRPSTATARPGAASPSSPSSSARYVFRLSRPLDEIEAEAEREEARASQAAFAAAMGQASSDKAAREDLRDEVAAAVREAREHREVREAAAAKEAAAAARQAAAAAAAAAEAAAAAAAKAKAKAEAAKANAATAAAQPLTVGGVRMRAGVTAEELREVHHAVRGRLEDRYTGLHQAFRSLDRDGSGYIGRPELTTMLAALNLSVRPPVLDSLIDLMDVENDVEDDDDAGPTDIGFREFARVFQAADILHLKAMAPSKRPKLSVAKAVALARLPPGVRAADVRQAQTALKEKLLTRFSSLSKAFKGLDKNRTGSITRAELEDALSLMQIAEGIKPQALTALIDLIDDEREGKIEFDEFAKLLSASDVLAMA